jgi:hypothetical protein
MTRIRFRIRIKVLDLVNQIYDRILTHMRNSPGTSMISSLSGGLSLINPLPSNIFSANHLGISSANHIMAN